MANEAVDNVEPQEPQEIQTLTWKNLHERFFEYLRKNKKGRQQRNFKRTFKLFMASAELTMESPVGAELAEDFELRLKIFVELQIEMELAESTYKPRVSKMRALKEYVDESFAPKLLQQTLPRTFGQRLLRLIKALGCTVMGFWRSLPERLISYSTFRMWCAEKLLPSVNFLHVIETIETHLKVPAGTLRPPRYLSAGHNLQIGVTDISSKTMAAGSKPYGFWNEILEGEFNGLYRLKTEAILPEGVERGDNAQWTSSEGEDADVPSADIALNFLTSFLGFCALPADSHDPYLRGAGIKHKELSMALLTVKGLTESYIKFMKLRSGLRVRLVKADDSEHHASETDGANTRREYYDVGGKYNNGTIIFLSLVSSLLRPGTGYLYQHPEFAEKLGTRMEAVTWHQQCRDTRTRVDVLYKQILGMKKRSDQENFDFGRDPREVINWLLHLPRPLLVLHQMIKDMLDDLLPEYAPLEVRARQFRDILLIAMLTSNPLRIHMFSIMQFGKHLTRDHDGTWWLQFKRGAFKNRRALKCHYKVRVARELWPLLDRYKREFHPVLAAPTQSAYVFVTSGRPKGLPMSAAGLSITVRNLTELYIPDAIGFRAHAFRHIVATDIIKRDPKLGFFLASIALHDRLETVEEAYIHLKTSEYFEPVNTHFSEAWSMVFGHCEKNKELSSDGSFSAYL